MKHSKLTRLIALFVLIVTMSSCYQGSWANYGYKSHYLHKRHFHRYNKHNRDW